MTSLVLVSFSFVSLLKPCMQLRGQLYCLSFFDIVYTTFFGLLFHGFLYFLAQNIARKGKINTRFLLLVCFIHTHTNNQVTL